MVATDLHSHGYWDGVARSYIPDGTLRIDPRLTLHRGAPTEVDPITFSVIRYALMNANFEHSRLIHRLSVSPIVMLARDFQCSILLEDGDLVFVGPNIQYFSNAQSLVAKWILENRSDSPGIAPGDMFLCNDPFIGAPHQPDTSLLHPIFVAGELFCWIGNTLHYADVGGVVPGSFCITATDAWQDPPAFPALKLVENGRIRRDMEELFVRQSRLRTNVLMDLRAAVAANQATARRIVELVERYGADRVKAVMRRIVDASETLFAERLRHVPDGAWSARTFVEASVPGDSALYRYQLNIEKRGERIYVDNRGTDRQAGCINITHVSFAGGVLTALAQAMVPDLAGAYGGAHRRVVFRPEAGLLNCAEFPAAVSISGAFTSELNINLATHAVARMLACGDRDALGRILGVPQPAFYGAIYMGLDGDGRPFVHPATDNMIGGFGGQPGRDGMDAGGHYWIPNGIAENVEHTEANCPVLYLYRRFLPGDHAGAGRTRGGLGVVQALVPWGAKWFAFAVATNESFTRANGMLGGNPGGRGSTLLRSGVQVQRAFAEGHVPQTIESLGGEETIVPPKTFGLPVEVDGGVFEWAGAATAGCGDPLLRDPEACRRDVEDGLFAPDAVAAVHGLVLHQNAAGCYEIDAAATIELRRTMLSARLGRPVVTVAYASSAPTSLVRSGDRWACGHCEHDLGPVSRSYKPATELRTDAIDRFAPGFGSPQPQLAAELELRSFLCPSCGARLDTELARVGDLPLEDIRLAP